MGFYSWISKLWQKDEAEKKAKNKLLSSLLILLFSSIGTFFGTVLSLVLSLIGVTPEVCLLLFPPIQLIFIVLSYIFVKYLISPLLPDLINRWFPNTYYGQLMWLKLQYEQTIEEIRESDFSQDNKKQLEQNELTEYLREKKLLKNNWRYRTTKAPTTENLQNIKQELQREYLYRKEIAEHTREMQNLASENPANLNNEQPEKLQLHPADNSNTIPVEVITPRRRRNSTINRETT